MLSLFKWIKSSNKTGQRLHKSTVELEKYKTVIDQSPVPMYIINNEMCFEYINHSFTRQSGYTEADLLGKHVNDTIYKKWGKIPETGNFIKEALMQGEKWEGKLLFLHKDGHIYWARTIASPLKNDQGKVNGHVFFAELKAKNVQFEGKATSFIAMPDNTEREQIEQALRESEEKYRALVENSQDCIMIIRDNKLLYANHTYCQMLGYDYQELLLKPSIEPIIPEDRHKAFQIAERRKSFDFTTIRDNVRMFKKNGEICECECVASVIEYNGVPASFMTLHDITENNRMQEALARSERRFRELTEMLPQAIYELDVDNTPTFMNKTGRKMFQFGEMDFSKSKAYDFFSPEDTQRMRKALEEDIKNVKIENGELLSDYSRAKAYTAHRMDGTTFPVLIYGTPIVEDGVVTGSRGMIIDITERVVMENELRESEEKYRALVNNANDGIVLTQDGLVKLVNKAMCDILQFQHEDFKDRTFYDYVVPEDRGEMKEYHKRRMKGEQFNVLYRSHLIRRDGKIITVELNSRTLSYNNRPAAFIIIRDITERIVIENELKVAKSELEILNKNLESRVQESSKKLAETHLQLINLQKENIQSQFDVLRQQVNPHFLFNSLNVLTSLIKIEPDLAEQFSEHLSKVYRYVLENKDNELVDLSTELRFLDAYIFLLNIRFVDKIKVNINIPNEKLSAQLIPLAVQLLIENAIKHNIMTKCNPLVIDIFIDENNYLNIINNLQERPSQVVSTGIGLKNIENRYLLLNNTRPIFEKSESQFMAKVPLVLK